MAILMASVNYVFARDFTKARNIFIRTFAFAFLIVSAYKNFLIMNRIY